MQRIITLIVLSFASLASAQVTITGSWQPQTVKPDLAYFGRHNLDVSTFAVKAEVGVLSDRLALFGAVGTGHAEMAGMGIDGSIDHYWRGGFNVTAWRAGPWSLGLTADVQQWKAQDSFLLADHPFGSRLNLVEYRVRPTLAYDAGQVTVYGGPSATWLDGSWTLFWGGTREERQRVHTTAELGGVLGAHWEIHPHVILTGEGELSEAGRSAVVAVGYRF